MSGGLADGARSRSAADATYEGPRTKRLRQKYGHERLVTADAAQREPPPLTPQKGGSAASAGTPKSGGGCKDLEVALKELDHPSPNAIRAPPQDLLTIDAAWFEKKWEVKRTVGHTASTQVLLATHRETGEERAIKSVDKKKFLRGQQRKSSNITLVNEVRILEGLRHPNIVQMHEAFQTEEHLYIVMEYHPCDLYKSIDKGGLFKEPLARRLFCEVCGAVAYLHERGIIHRDIKPENVLLTSEDRELMSTRLADFGISRVTSGGCETYCGTRSYVAPEVVRQRHFRNLALLKASTSIGAAAGVQDKENAPALGEAGGAPGRYGRPADVWCLGILLYIMLSGFPPFDPDSEVLHAEIINGSWQFDVPEWKEVSSLAKELVAWLMTVDPSKRPSIQDALGHAWIRRLG